MGTGTETSYAYEPDVVYAPGETLAEWLGEHDMTQTDLASRAGQSAEHINQMVEGAAPVTTEAALGPGAGHPSACSVLEQPGAELPRASRPLRFDADASARDLATISPDAVLDGNRPRLLDEWQLAPVIWNCARRAVRRRLAVARWGDDGRGAAAAARVPRRSAPRPDQRRLDAQPKPDAGGAPDDLAGSQHRRDCAGVAAGCLRRR